MHRVKKSLYAFCFFFLRNLDFTIDSYPIQINRYRIRIIRSVNLALCNRIILPAAACQAHICKELQITLIGFQSNRIA